MEHEAAHRKKRAQIEEQAEALFQTIDEDESGTLDTMEMAWALAEVHLSANIQTKQMLTKRSHGRRGIHGVLLSRICRHCAMRT
eukprot:SAG11_NODE_78_length_17939_cov_10.236883_11_plen_84_part_00